MQIPKTILSIWLGDPPSDEIKKCLETHALPGYEFLMVTGDNYHHCQYVDECVAGKRWAKAADYLRMYYLMRFGGVYLDADTTVLKPFDDLLDNQMFVCEEKNGFISNAIVGAVPGHPVLKEYLRIVETNFIGSGDLVFEPGMGLWTQLIKHRRMPGVKVYPAEWFIPFNWQTGRTNITENTHCIHHFNKSWL